MLATILKGHLAKEGVSTRKLAEEIGVTHQTIANWAARRGKPNSVQMASLLDAMDASPTDRRAWFSAAFDVSTDDVPRVVGA